MVKLKKAAIFFDRDGTLIHTLKIKNKPIAINKIAQFKIYSDAKKVLNTLKKKYNLFVVTNQPDVGKGFVTKQFVNMINKRIKNKLPIKKIYTCFCKDNKCKFKKPNTGFIIKAKNKYNLDLSRSYVIGDRWRDIDLGNNAKCKTIFLHKGYCENLNTKPNYVAKKLKDIIKYID